MYDGSDRRDDDHRDVRTTRSGISPALIAFVVVLALVVVFIIQNRDEAEIEFLFFQRRDPIWIAIAIAIVLGVILDRLFAVWWRRRRRDR